MLKIGWGLVGLCPGPAIASLVFLNSYSIKPYYNRANTFLKLKKWKNSLIDLKFIAKKYPDSSKIYFAIGIANNGLLKYRSALNFFFRSLFLSKNKEIYNNIGTIYYFMKKYKLSESFIKKAIEINNNNAYAYNTWGMIKGKLMHYKIALVLINNAIFLEPNQSFFYNNRGYIYINTKKYKESKKNINTSIFINPYNAWSYRNKGIFYIKKNKYKIAKKIFKKAKNLNNKIEELYYYMAKSYFMLYEKNKSLALWKRELKNYNILFKKKVIRIYN